MVVKYNKGFSLEYRSRLISAGLHQAMQLTDYACSTMVGCRFSILAVPASCFPGVPLPYQSSVAFFACGHPASGMSVTLLPAAVVRVKSNVFSFFVPPCAPGES